ncbi:MAG: SUMF1/EgtB/PvdO family nonheme iron enzyme [Candidatus Eisenbacteria bacterium]|uniref:SUMF1/EgtB/PvdO family nonheme iron enzyme n=1 Tax=Eiseniibacteriota bacterium TaxID=2212470 RepID=A0A948W7K4_UNCEI|nr:SUMF1/EgtB/PvdO family nonheme iron enzyme [Candidatus Eisenbacteria bacterium]MBU1947922.1 SUMF1/EgtB/PvdO family nonheme iron enzyme [Candidatus Eisenbacteria bacterium]MBU2692335.1 SUMF1/EgtB/PvdO family nonheme iron enzyme [Candidatus Eisenbacteria bacterium]
MVRLTTRWVGIGLGVLTALSAVILMLPGCAEQDLYKPPVSPYEVLSVLPLPASAEDVDVLGDIAYIACGQAGLITVDISNPYAPVILSQLDTKKFAESIVVASTPFGDGVIEIAFIVEGTEGVTTWDVTHPDSVFSFHQGTTAVDGNGLCIKLPDNPGDPYIIYLAENWKGLRIFKSDPFVPGLLNYEGAFAYGRGYAKAVAVEDGFAYVADDEMGVTVFDVRNPVLGQMDVVSYCDTDGWSRGIAVHDGIAYVADGYNGFVIMETHGAEPPVPIGHYLEVLGLCRDVVYRDGLAFVAAQDGGVHIFDVRNPAKPEHIGSNITSYAQGIALSSSGLLVVADRSDGLVILGGPGPFNDTTPPAAIGDLAAVPVDSTSIRLEWHATGNDLYNGRAAEYDIRYSELAITEAIWDSSAVFKTGFNLTPATSGTAESYLVENLIPGTPYTFAIKVADTTPNWSGISNVASAVTPLGNVPPTLSNGTVSPEAGAPETQFIFSVLYTDGDGDAPIQADVIINGTNYAMQLVSGDYENGATYHYETALSVGSYEHAFAFDDGEGHAIQTPLTRGPWAGTVLQMGSPLNEVGHGFNETLHTVVLTHDFWISDHEVTQAEYEDVMGVNPSRFDGDNLPVEKVTWLDAVSYCNIISDRDGYELAYTIDGSVVTWNKEADGYRLPTEAEWEYACRAGTQTATCNGNLTEEACGVDPVLDAVGWYCGNAAYMTHDVMSKAPNSMDLYDMHGNVWEWCWDIYMEDLGTDVVVDPSGPPGGAQRVVKGGSWYYYARECRSASRAPYWPNSQDDILGFRVARTVPSSGKKVQAR